MREDREPMERMEGDAPALGVEERSDEAPRAGAGQAISSPDPEVVSKPTQCRFTVEYRLRILEEADRCTFPGEAGRLLRREGPYSSHLSPWRKTRRNSSLKAPTPKKHGAKPVKPDPISAKVREIEEKAARLEKEIATSRRRRAVPDRSKSSHGAVHKPSWKAIFRKVSWKMKIRRHGDIESGIPQWLVGYADPIRHPRTSYHIPGALRS